ncbi:MAG: ABC transporter substrate-binding protein [Spirochaetales bacterium]
MKNLFRLALGLAVLATAPLGFSQTKITFWYGLTGFNGEVVKQVVDKYNASQTKYVVEAVSQPDYDATINKLNTSLAGGELPNVVQVYDVGTQRMIDTKKVVAVGDLITRDKLDIASDLEPAVASYYTLGGKLWSMPFNTSTPVMYFDRTAFKAAGLDLNKKVWTYDELLAAAKKLTVKDASGNVTRYGLGYTIYGWYFEQQLALQAALYADPNNGRTDRATKLTFNNAAGVSWLNFLKKTLDDGVARSYGMDGGANSTARDSAFVNGEVSIIVQSIAGLRGYLTNAKTAGKGVDVGVAYFPRPAGAKGGVIIGGASLWLTSTGSPEQQAGAWDFTKFAASPETQAFFASSTGYYPVRKASYAQADMKATLAQYPQFQVAVDQLHDSPALPATQGAAFGTFVKSRANTQVAIDQFLSGKFSTAQAALDDAAKKSSSELAEYNALTN